MKKLWIIIGIVCFPLPLLAQSSLILRNSTDFTLQIAIEQSGTDTLSPSDYNQKQNAVKGWLEDDFPLVTVNRDSNVVSNGDTIVLQALLIHGMDTIRYGLRLIGTQNQTNFAYSVDGPNFSHPWFTDGNFHADTTTIGNKQIAIKYKPENPDTSQSRDVLLALHQTTVAKIDSADFQDSTVLNIMSYNLQMLPLGVSSLPNPALRSDLFPKLISPWQDVVIYQEIFDDPPRKNNLVPAMEKEGFVHHTTILNEPPTGVNIPVNGGVMIFSKWPITQSDEFEFSKCGPASQDCAANKGIKYARINKLGNHYHVFGTHFDAGDEQQDTEARRSQIGELRQFIDMQNIPAKEPVIFGGDLNIDPLFTNMLYQEFIDSLNPVVPEPIGFYETTFNADTGNIIDHIWADSRHLLPLRATNDIVTFRSIQDTMWQFSEFSDHRAVLGRFEYPEIGGRSSDSVACIGDTLAMNLHANINVGIEWMKNGQPLPGQTDSQFVLQPIRLSDTGRYSGNINYEVTFGTINNNIVTHLYPNGPKVFQANLNCQLARAEQCVTSVSQVSSQPLNVYPNPTSGRLRLQFTAQSIQSRPQLQLYDMTGRMIMNQQLAKASQSTSIDLTHLQQGVYLLSITAQDQHWTYKIRKR